MLVLWLLVVVDLVVLQYCLAGRDDVWLDSKQQQWKLYTGGSLPSVTSFSKTDDDGGVSLPSACKPKTELVSGGGKWPHRLGQRSAPYRATVSVPVYKHITVVNGGELAPVPLPSADTSKTEVVNGGGKLADASLPSEHRHKIKVVNGGELAPVPLLSADTSKTYKRLVMDNVIVENVPETLHKRFLYKSGKDGLWWNFKDFDEWLFPVEFFAESTSPTSLTSSTPEKVVKAWCRICRISTKSINNHMKTIHLLADFGAFFRLHRNVTSPGQVFYYRLLAKRKFIYEPKKYTDRLSSTHTDHLSSAHTSVVDFASDGSGNWRCVCCDAAFITYQDATKHPCKSAEDVVFLSANERGLHIATMKRQTK